MINGPEDESGIEKDISLTEEGQEDSAIEGQEDKAVEEQEDKTGKEDEESSSQGKESEGEEEDFLSGMDYGGMLDENDTIPVGNKKMKYGEALKLIEKAESHKELFEAIEKNPALKDQLLKKAASPEAQPKEGHQLTAEQKVMVSLLQREYVREWDKVKDKYDLVTPEEVFAKMHSEQVYDPGQVGAVAEKLQAYFDRKLALKEKQRIAAKEKARETNFDTGGGPNPPGKSKDSDDIDIGDIDQVENSIRSYKR